MLLDHLRDVEGFTCLLISNRLKTHEEVVKPHSIDRSIGYRRKIGIQEFDKDTVGKTLNWSRGHRHCPAVVTNGCVKSLIRGSHVDTESGGRIGHIEDGESVAGSVGGLWAG